MSEDEKKRERYLYVLNALIGREIHVEQLENEEIQGLFHTSTVLV